MPYTTTVRRLARAANVWQEEGLGGLRYLGVGEGTGGHLKLGELFSCSDVAGALALHAKTVERWCRSGLIRAVRLGVRWRVTAEEVERIRREGVRG